MNQFKLLRGNEEDDDSEPIHDDGPSWMWDLEFGLRPVENHTWILTSDNFYGIISFLNYFPNNFIVPVHSITGNGIRHSFDNRNNGNGWGFDVTSDLLTIEFYILVPNPS